MFSMFQTTLIWLKSVSFLHCAQAIPFEIFSVALSKPYVLYPKVLYQEDDQIRIMSTSVHVYEQSTRMINRDLANRVITTYLKLLQEAPQLCAPSCQTNIRQILHSELSFNFIYEVNVRLHLLKKSFGRVDNTFPFLRCFFQKMLSLV